MNFPRMKVLIQNPETLLYFEGLDSWSPRMEDAYDFADSEVAITFCASHGITPVRVVLSWEGTGNSISLPIIAQHQKVDSDSRRHGKINP
jgi:hypothetical protein